MRRICRFFRHLSTPPPLAPAARAEAHEHDARGRLVRTVLDDGSELRFPWDSEEQMVRILREADEEGVTATSKKHGISDQTERP